MLSKADPAKMVEENGENQLSGDNEANQLACAQSRSKKIYRAHYRVRSTNQLQFVGYVI
jgi:hypothetical protein